MGDYYNKELVEKCKNQRLEEIKNSEQRESNRGVFNNNLDTKKNEMKTLHRVLNLS